MIKKQCNKCKAIGHINQAHCWNCGSLDLTEIKVHGINPIAGVQE